MGGGTAVESTHALAKLRSGPEKAIVVVLKELGVEALQAGDLEVLRRVAECRKGGLILTSPFATDH